MDTPMTEKTITPRENFRRVLDGKKPCWIPFASEMQDIRPRIFPDNVACGLVRDAEEPLTPADFSGKGWFDTEWFYVELVGGATTMPGKAQLSDMNDWKSLNFPDVSGYDFAASAEKNNDFFDRSKINYINMICGYWERLMALMEVTDAAMAMIDEDQKAAIHEFFDKLTDLYIELADKTMAYGLDMIMWHDDWGTNGSYFFSVATLNEMIIPHLKRLADHIHSLGLYFNLHSCGHNENNVPSMIAAGVDIWGGQPLNDYKTLAQKYSKDIVIGVYPPAYTAETGDEELRFMTEEFFETYKDLRVYVIDRRMPDDRFKNELKRMSTAYYK